MVPKVDRKPGGKGERRAPGQPRPTRGRRYPAAFRDIVVCLDRSTPAEAAMLHALRMADREGARVTLLNVLEPSRRDATSGLPPDPIEWQLRRSSAQAYLDALRERPHPESVRLGCEIVQGDAAEQVCAHAAHANADLVVFATHGQGLRTEYRLGGTAAKLVERLPISLLVVPAASSSDLEIGVAYRRILVPLDGSRRAESVLPLVTELARDHGAEVLLVHVVCTPETLPAEPPEPEDVELQRRARRRGELRAIRYLTRLQGRLVGAGARARTLVLRGDCARSEIEHALGREGVDLVVVSSHGKTGLTDEALGSVTSHLIRTHAVPVLVVRDEGALAAWRRRAAAEAEAAPPPAGPDAR